MVVPRAKLTVSRRALFLSCRDEGNADQFGKDAHHLKGSAAAIGAMAMMEACRLMQDAGEAGDLDAGRKALSQAEKENKTVNEELDRLYREEPALQGA